mgnify:CR=1 FL=1
MEKKELLSKLNNLKNEINQLRNRLNSISKDKELWFNKKESLKHEIQNIINEFKTKKQEKDDLNLEIKKSQDERDNYNKKVKELIEKIKILNQKKLEFIKKHKVKINIDVIKQKIEELEFRIETEALKLNRENRLMKQIKDLKKIYNENYELKVILDEINSLDKDIKDNRKKADELHNKLSELSKSRGYDYLREYSKKIDDLKKVQQEAFNNFIKLKNEFLQVNNELKSKLNEAALIKKEIDEINRKDKMEKQLKAETEFKEKEKLVEEKLKTSKKLTKDDLIFLQNEPNNK